MECEKTVVKNGIITLEPKVKYDTLEEAIKACKIINSIPNRVDKLVSYKCSKCYKFHVGRNGKSIEAKKKLSNSKLQELYGKSVHIPSTRKEFKGFTLVGNIDLTQFEKK